MNTASISPGETPAPKPLRLWPGVVLVALQWLLRFVVPFLVPDAAMIGVLGALGCGLLLVVWWLFFSRAPWLERLGALALLIVAVPVTKLFVHPSIAGGMMGMMPIVYAVPLLSLALVAWAAASRGFAAVTRRASLIGAVALACGALTLMRTGGVSGLGGADLHWRWSATPEERLLARAGKTPGPPVAAPGTAPATVTAANSAAPWPGFRGPQRDGIVRSVRIETDWAAKPPTELWRRPVGPAWSSFAIEGDRFYTQEQRGEQELVSCYHVTTGAPVWSHADTERFWESNAGAGPRGTPTLSGGRVYTFGGTGILNALDARTGAVIWSRNAASATGKRIPDWGFASSPLVVGDTIVVATAGVLAAYDAATGKTRWIGEKGGWGYSSPHLATIGGVAQILLLHGVGAQSVGATDGKPLWKHEWQSDGIVQPIVLADGQVLLGSGSGLGVKIGVRCVSVARGDAGWTAGERWTSPALRPYFNDFVALAGHAYGFDHGKLACLELAAGERKWKGGPRYGAGQILALAEQGLLLVLAEDGQLALVKAAPDRFTELARVPALKGKTWNHPALVGDVLLVRNSEEMAAFRLAPLPRT